MRAPLLRSFVVASLVGVALAGYAGTGIGEPTPQARESETPTPARTPTPEPTRPALGDLVLTPQGIADVKLGQPVPAGDTALQPYLWDGTACGGSGVPEGEPYAGYWSSVEAGTPRPYGGLQAFVFITDGGVRDGAVVAVRVWNTVRTAAGVGPGSTRAELEAAYPGIELYHEPGANSDLYEISENGNRIVFEVADDSDQGGGYWEPELNETILWMWAEHDSGIPYGIAGTDGGSPCLA